jgi:hypothetical protein
MAAARFLGDPAGKAWWDPRFHTYASDTVLGLALWRLGWEVRATASPWVEDGYTSADGHLDPLRLRNSERYDAEAGQLFVRLWGDPATVDYNRGDAERCGGRLL